MSCLIDPRLIKDVLSNNERSSLCLVIFNPHIFHSLNYILNNRGSTEQENRGVESSQSEERLNLTTATEKIAKTPTKIERFMAQNRPLETLVAEGADKVQEQPVDSSVRLDPELNKRLNHTTVPKEVKDSIASHFNSLDTARAKQDTQLLKQALDGDGENVDRAVMAFDKITKIPDSQQRLTQEIKSTLIQGVAQCAMPAKIENGVDQSTGQAGVLGGIHAQELQRPLQRWTISSTRTSPIP
jgi:hypothetical protein